jgi:hypothetical protein
MKGVLALLLALAMAASVTATALAKGDDKGHYGKDRHGHHDRYDQGDRDRGHNDGHDKHFRPFKWRDHHRSFDKHHMERIHDRNIERHHPGLHAYKWRGYGDGREGFWHNGHHVRDAILFFNDEDEVVSFGYMRDGVFIYVREDEGFEERDPFFFLQWFIR